MPRIINVIIEKASDKNYSCFMEEDVDKWSVYGVGSSVQNTIDDFYSGLKDAKDSMEEEGKEMPELKFRFLMDVGSIFDYYPINVTAFAKYIGMNASLLRQYASGKRAPKEKALAKIRAGLQKLKDDINVGTLIERPVLDYVK